MNYLDIRGKRNLGLLLFFSLGITGCWPFGGGSSEPRPETQTTPVSQPTPSVPTRNQVVSQALGLRNLGNTCFANSVHKLLWAHPQTLAATAPESRLRPFQNTPVRRLQLNRSSRRESQRQEVHARTELQTAFHELFTELNQSQETLGASSHLPTDDIFQNWLNRANYSSQLNTIYDKLEHSLRSVENRTTLNLDGDRIRQNQFDAKEYLSIVADHLEFDRLLSPLHIRDRNGTHLSTGISLEIQPDQLGTDDLENSLERYLQTLPVSAGAVAPGEFYVRTPENVPPSAIIAIERVILDPASGNPIKSQRPLQLNPRVTISFHVEETGQIVRQEMFPKAVVVQHGNVGGGHFFAYLYDTVEKSWYEHNDSSVRKISADSLEAATRDMEQNSVLILVSTR